ncbi:helix-turn-helix transcriptional regulator [Trinickia dinghuensis]|uniref:LuxR family transcriptional regulator n=1 Tax=Trinickia dinghuensis TaxID=2291023 RepID=A0A3D8JYW5_9BURK|nr:LuxR family transcriptional regulator [Trinickia dinghuensis]RDU98080.1 LuxR family transcriptional regulator [Trinickia dinghuensis]
MHYPALRKDDSALAPLSHSCGSESAVAGRGRTIEVVWCNDPRQLSLAARHTPRLGIATALAAAQSACERSRMVNSLLHLIGFSTFAYFALEFGRERVERLFLHEAFIPGTYRGDYVRERYHDVDPRTVAARQGRLPLVWDLQQLHARAPCLERGDAAQEGLDGFIKMMREDGMRSGLMFAMPIPGTRMHAFMSFTGQRRTHDWITSTTLEQALAIGLSVHTVAAQQLTAAARERTTDELTEFERELLLGIAEGASDKEIGRRLDTSAHNVDYHLRKLRKRFGVANRTELTYLTSKLELI